MRLSNIPVGRTEILLPLKYLKWKQVMRIMPYFTIDHYIHQNLVFGSTYPGHCFNAMVVYHMRNSTELLPINIIYDLQCHPRHSIYRGDVILELLNIWSYARKVC